MLNTGFLLVQEKAQDEVNFLQMSPCWPCLVPNFAAPLSAVHWSQKSHFHCHLCGVDFHLSFRKPQCPAHRAWFQLRHRLFIFGRGLQYRKHCLPISFLHPKSPLPTLQSSVGRGEQRGLYDRSLSSQTLCGQRLVLFLVSNLSRTFVRYDKRKLLEELSNLEINLENNMDSLG